MREDIFELMEYAANAEVTLPMAERLSKGCLARQGVCFISYKGEVFGCGYLPVAAGDLRKQDFKTIWFESGGGLRL